MTPTSTPTNTELPEEEVYELSRLGNVFHYGIGEVFDLGFDNDTARDIAIPSLERLGAVGREVYVLTAGGGVVRLTDSAPAELLNGDFLGFDFARDVELVNDEGGRVILDGAGFLHTLPEDLSEGDFKYQGSPFFYEVVTSGGLPLVVPTDDAVDLEITADGQNYMILRRDGRIYFYGDSFPFGVRFFPKLIGAEAVDLEIVPGEAGYWILDSQGNIHRYEDTPTLPGLESLPIPNAMDFEFSRTGKGIYVMDAYGAVYPFGDDVVDLIDAEGPDAIWKAMEVRKALTIPEPTPTPSEESPSDAPAKVNRLIRSEAPRVETIDRTQLAE